MMIAASLIAAPLTLPAADGGSRDKALLAARDAFSAGDRAKLARQAEKVRGHLLESYAVFWGLRLRLDRADPGELHEFLARNSGTLLADQLRREWLRLLGRNGQWELFRREHPALVKDDPEVACYALQERWLNRDESVPPALRRILKEQRALPEGCALLTEAMARSGDLTPRDLADRFRVLVRAGLIAEAKRLGELFPGGQLPRAHRIDRIVQAPAAYLEGAGAELDTAAGRELAIAALTRLAQNDPEAAVNRWRRPALRERFGSEERGYVWGVLAEQGARRHLPEALAWFGEAGAAPLSDEQLAWRARIALRQGDWREVKAAIERMEASVFNEPVWVYWLGRALCELGAPEEGKRLFGCIAQEHHFYGQLAAEELGIPLTIPPQAAPPTKEEIARVASLGGIKRALALYRLGLRSEATAEWVWAIRPMEDRQLLAAAELARRNGIWDRAINTADKTVSLHDFSMRYPAPYGKVLAEQARLRQIDEPWVLGLVRQESRFIVDARSSAGASGLMQLLPATARWVARKIGMKGYHASRVNQPRVNVALGAFYLRHVMGGLDGSPVLAAAAYNAGPGRARRWLDARPLEGAIYIETIPFAETRHYVKNVMANTVYYDALRGGEGRSLKSRLGMVKRGAAKSGAAEQPGYARDGDPAAQ